MESTQRDYLIALSLLLCIVIGIAILVVAGPRIYKNEKIDRCHRMQRFAQAGFPPSLSERIDCEDVGVKVILVPNETTG